MRTKTREQQALQAVADRLTLRGHHNLGVRWSRHTLTATVEIVDPQGVVLAQRVGYSVAGAAKALRDALRSGSLDGL